MKTLTQSLVRVLVLMALATLAANSLEAATFVIRGKFGPQYTIGAHRAAAVRSHLPRPKVKPSVPQMRSGSYGAFSIVSAATACPPQPSTMGLSPVPATVPRAH